MDYDVLVIGAGISGMEAALSLGDMGFKVLLVEKEASIGGKMILLSKVFPTLDCSSCISTPKMAAVANHSNIEIAVYSEVKEILKKDNGSFAVRIEKKPTYVNPAKCTGCAQCESVCTVAIPDQFNSGMIARRAIYIPFPQAVPKKAVIERHGQSPCSHACPGGVKAHGYCSLVRAGRFDEAFHLHMEDAPLPGSLSRLCFAPCEKRCTRGMLEGPVQIRAIKRFMVDRYYQNHLEPEYGPPKNKINKKTAVIGSGPSGLTAAYFLAKSGYEVTIFEPNAEIGGILRDAVKKNYLPASVLDRDIKNITALGVNLITKTKIASLKTLLNDGGFDAIYLALDSAGLDSPETSLDFASELSLKPDKSPEVDKETLQTSMPNVFAGGGITADPSKIILAMAHGKRAAFYIDRYIKGESLNIKFDDRAPSANKQEVFKRTNGKISFKAPLEFANNALITDKEARYEANRCLDCGGCSECHQCVAVCPAVAISFEMKPEEQEFSVGSILISTGFKLFNPRNKPALGYGRFPNVIDAMQMDRLLAPTRPYNAVLRPSDGKTPNNIAFILCTGSRDKTVRNPVCSRVCCMYSAKQAQLIMGALPIAEITIYYMDIRAFGKGYDEFYEQARAMGVHFIKGKVARIEETADQDLILYYEDIEEDSRVKRAVHDLVVLSVGGLPNLDALDCFKGQELGIDPDSFFIAETDEAIEPGQTTIEGVFVAGTASGVRDIPDNVLHAGAAAAQVAAYLKRMSIK
ncbi:MAG: FAD-dependent oxidoreductase [Dissulfurimicrobium sp.]|uniref:FAD-dependent oxidoreductase n=1 Tax=Dissulfurimicrobium sp. TaxID=2022436 RepID=UPI00404B3F14